MTTLRSSPGKKYRTVMGETSNRRCTRSMAKSEAGDRPLVEAKRRPTLRPTFNRNRVAASGMNNVNRKERKRRSVSENKEAAERNNEESSSEMAVAKSDLPSKFSSNDVSMRLMFANNSSLMKGTVQSFADICSRTTNGNRVDGVLNCWREHGEYRRISKQDRLGAFRESEEMYKKCKVCVQFRVIHCSLFSCYLSLPFSIIQFISCDTLCIFRIFLEKFGWI